jgi:hypothetical protein
MIADKMLLVPWIVLYTLVVLDAAEDDLAEAVIIGDVDHLVVHYLVHEVACALRVVNLFSKE